ncbi:MAG: hypothetical protein K6E98_11155 [Lachnospiraceae bacterium]|nr:hypothetical protein [Lachnospiraceae bacterium]
MWVNKADQSFLNNLSETGLDNEGIYDLIDKFSKGEISISNIPQSISIANVKENALPFSENIEFDLSQPGILAVGRWGDRGDLWDFINNYETENKAGLEGSDICFTYATFGDSTLKYGVKNILKDSNIDSSSIGNISNIKFQDYHVIEKEDVWIQYSDIAEDGMYIKCVDASCEGLGMDSVDLSTRTGAKISIDKTAKALSKTNTFRSQFGAYQNQLEHRYNINNNTSENTQAAESAIRDTDMAKEIMNVSKLNIIEQASQSMLAQANQQRAGILNLLQ